MGTIAASYLDHLDRLGAETPIKPLQNKSKAGPQLEKELPLVPVMQPAEVAAPEAAESRLSYYLVPDPSGSETIKHPVYHELIGTLGREADPRYRSIGSDAVIPAKASRFKLKLQRTSGSTSRSIRIAKPRPSAESDVQRRSNTVILVWNRYLVMLMFK